VSSDGTAPQGPAWVHDLARVRALQAATTQEDPHYWAISLRLLQLIELALATDDTDELLSEAIGNATSLRGIPLDDESLAFVEMSLATNLVERFRRGGQRSDLDAALEIRFARVAAGCPTTVYSDLINLASALLLSWNHTSRVEHLHEVIARLGPACGGDTPGHVKPDVEERVKLAANLATAYGHRFDLQRQPDDLALSITMFRTALTAADPDTAAGLSVNLATGLLDAYRTGLGDSDDLDEAVALIRRATQHGECKVNGVNRDKGRF
jgi:hypothetical protein